MPTKGSRGNTGHLRPHSRSSSSTRLGGGPNANLQFTQKDVLNAATAALTSKHADKGKNRGPEAHKVPPQFARVNSSQRIHSKEQLALAKKQFQQSQLQAQYQNQQQRQNKGKPGFGFASQSSKDEDDDEEWVSSESGMNTPNNRNSDSEETASDSEVPHPDVLKQMDAKQIKKLQQQQQYQQQLRMEQARMAQRREQELQQQVNIQQMQNQPRRPHPVQTDFQPQVQPPLERTDTARQTDFEQTFVERGNRVPTPVQMQRANPPPVAPQHPNQQQLTQAQILQLQQQQYNEQLRYQQEMAKLNYLRQQQSTQEAQLRAERELQVNVQQHQPVTQHNGSPPSPPSPETATTTSSRQSPRPKRTSRPPSTHSIISNRDSILRPHPLIRGQSYGNINPVQPPKQAPLAPLTVIPNAATPLSSSPGASGSNLAQLSSSPGSMRASPSSPASIDIPPPHFITNNARRTSFSSLRSVNTIPVHPTIIREAGTNGSPAYSAISNLTNGGKPYDRARTISTLSNLSSSSVSAAFSSLVHLPHSSASSTLIGGATRPPSPQTVAYFPPTNPHANIEGIHPLLPGPYLTNHLTVLAKRAPIRESFERVMKAKNTKANNGTCGL
ncbi:hypothetical protein CVT24_004132 [Panaeolus cyanescens]|uniref:Uncharacterized protein n=1 Tax=Panaeolus cyanescens TaxID=181874 RepID=A0A409Y670_9AGAR|nr:hypothetical protein CVT24_004132 [Panaeolus cyanescens]